MVIAAIVLGFLSFSACMSIIFGKAMQRLASENDYDWTSFPRGSTVASHKFGKRKRIASC